MKDYSQLDEIDLAILDHLQRDSSISNVELARLVNLSPPAVHTRIRRLEQEAYITGYCAILNREQLGYDMLCFIQVSLQVHQPEQVQEFRQRVAEMPEVLECHHITGNIDYLLKVVVQNQKDLQRFLMDSVTPIPGIARMQTSIILTEIKSTTILPITE